MKTFTDDQGVEHVMYQTNFFDPSVFPDTMQYAINLACVAFCPGGYDPYKEAEKSEIESWLHECYGLTGAAASYATVKGYEEYEKRFKKN